MNNLVNNQTINKIVDTFDECAMLYFDATTNELYESTSISNYDIERPHSNFYECLLKIGNFFLDDEELDITNEEVIKQITAKITELKTYLAQNNLNSEEVRRAFLLLDVKGFKNVNFSLDLITPDATALIISELVNFCTNTKDKVNLLDFNFGVGNLAFTISNKLNTDLHLIGFDNHPLLARVACLKANMMNIKLDMYNEDALGVIPTDIDIVVSDLASYNYENEFYTSNLYQEGVRYFPYLAIEHYLNLKSSVKYIYLIDNDFFNQNGSEKFKNILKQKGEITALIALPDKFFLPNQMHKSILILNNNTNTNNTSTEIFVLPNVDDQKHFMQVMNQIKVLLQTH